MRKAVRRVTRATFDLAMCCMRRRRRAGDAIILAYHNIMPVGLEPRGEKSLHLPFDQFEDQLDILKREADVVPLMDILTREDPSSVRVAITFDDAYVGACELGVRACVMRGFPVTVFVAPGLANKIPLWDALSESGQWDDKYRDAIIWTEQIARWGAHEPQLPETHRRWMTIADPICIAATSKMPGVTVGNHTYEHVNLGASKNPEIENEVRRAADWLRAHVGDAYIPVLAYPFGIPPRKSDQLFHEKLITFALLASGGWFAGEQRTDQYHVPRWNVPSGVSYFGFKRRLRGWI
jgi:peptidoglycan/xylan/chitin deacetylase (PgdA/CDA1 family)